MTRPNFTSPVSPLLLPLPDNGAVLRLFCIPFAGGGASTYARWSDGLPSEFQVCPIQLRGHESRFAETPFRSMQPLIEELGSALVPWIDIPFAIFGHSMGAIIGFELARHLRKVTGKVPLCVFASARRAPQLATGVRKIADLSNRDFVREMREQYNAIPDLILQDQELMERFIPILKADMALLESYEYRHEEPFSCMFSALGGHEDQNVGRAALEAWREQSSGVFKVRQFPGGHFYFKDARAQLLQAIGQDLIEVVGKGSAR